MAGIDGCLDVIFTVLIFVLSRCEGKLECLLTGLFVKSVTFGISTDTTEQVVGFLITLKKNYVNFKFLLWVNEICI
jgi:hypothetical protein